MSPCGRSAPRPGRGRNAIAAFALALQAWKTGGYRELPIPNIACSGISAKGRLEDWKKLAEGDERPERTLDDAPFSSAQL